MINTGENVGIANNEELIAQVEAVIKEWHGQEDTD